MFNFFIILICLILGYLSRFFKLINGDSYKLINLWVINIGLPSIALLYIPKIDWKLAHFFTASLPLFVFLCSFLFFKLIQLWLGFSFRTLVTLTLVSGLSNTSFVGFPLIITFFGEEQLKVGVVSDQSTFFTLSTIGVVLASSWKSMNYFSIGSIRFILHRIFTFPPFLACCFALFFGNILQFDNIQRVLKYLTLTVSPLAIFSIGLQLHFAKLHKEFKVIGISLIYKLLLAPSLCIALGVFLSLKGIFYQVSVFEMAMPSLVASSMVIEKFGLNTKLSNTIIGASIVIGLLISIFWHGVIITLL